MAGATSSSSSKVVHFVHSNTSKRAPQGDSWRASNSSNACPCGRCGATHPHKQCPAHGKTCHTCGGRDHFASVCRAPKRGHGQGQGYRGSQRRGRGGQRGSHRKNAVHSVEEAHESSDFFIDSISHEDNNESAWYATVHIATQKMDMKVDTGANTNCLPLRSFRRITGHERIPVKKTTTSLKMYSGEVIKPLGTVTLMIECNNTQTLMKFYVADVDSPPVLGLQACKLLGLVTKDSRVKSLCVYSQYSRIIESSQPMTREQFLTTYKDTFEGLGKLHEPYDICLRPGAVPVVHPPRRVPLAIHTRLKQKLDDMERAGVIRKTEKPTEWVNSLVIVEKRDQSLRLCQRLEQSYNA